ncbi:sigma-70 family RNA polymerase sigma factor [Pedobacter sp. JY14-1]|uniref:RNA polymerase sigma factor n=1 Tax=Pedobacter sp. JY14-1 TaxID=3034151 RepID=UPI0023E2032C|nr:sigma-70 family RNA polymerase sigma factor [Pedobacter sp. JY14-1]
MPHEDLNTFSDADLLLEIGKGSRSAFDVIYNRYWKEVYNAAFKRLDDEQQAQDITQDVFVQLWLRASDDAIENLSAYLRVSARNGVFKYFERAGRLSLQPYAGEEQSGGPASADSGIAYREFYAAFQKLIENLPEQQRIIFRLRFDEDLSSLEIAEKLNISPKTVRNQLGKSLATLRKSLILMQILFFLYPVR